LSIHEYRRCQKQIADSLAENDSPISDRALVLNTLRGLGPRFASAATVISMTDPLPTFLRVRAMLLMEDMKQANTASNAVSTTLEAQARHPPPPCTGAGCRSDTLFLGKGKPDNKNKPKGGRTDGGNQCLTLTSTPAPTGPWICFSPGMGQWRAPTAAGILSPRPKAHYSTAPLVYQSSTSSLKGHLSVSTFLIYNDITMFCVY
jgi:hypothetical protein